MKTIRFTAYPDGYRCSEPGDQSGEYVTLQDAAKLAIALKEAEALIREFVAAETDRTTV